jgi:microcystin degradation protein MlrC
VKASRIAVGGMFHESNTFSNVATTYADFEAYQLHGGEGLRALVETRSDVGGFFAAAAAKGWTASPVLYAAALPSGPVDGGVFRRLVDDFCARIEAIAPDGVLLALHGAMVADDEPEADAVFVERVRAAAGGIPIVADVDFHANVSERLAATLDGLVAYRTYPHSDMYDAGLRAAELLDDALRRGAPATLVHRKLPLLTPPQAQYTASEPMRTLLDLAAKLEEEHNVVLALTPGFPYADVPHAGFSICATGRRGAAERAVAAAAAAVEEQAASFAFDALSVGAALDRVAAGAPTPVVLVDSADNVGGGAPGDGTEILREWLARGFRGLVVFIADAEAAASLAEERPGARVQLALGGKTDDLHGAPVAVEGRLLRLGDGRFTYTGTYNTGYQTSMGATAVLDVAGNTVVVTQRKVAPFDAGVLSSLDIDPADATAIVVKSAIAWRAAFEPIAATVIEVDAPGICTGRLARLPFSEGARRRFCPSEQAAV